MVRGKHIERRKKKEAERDSQLLNRKRELAHGRFSLVAFEDEEVTAERLDDVLDVVSSLVGGSSADQGFDSVP